MLRMRSLVCIATLTLLGAACGSSGETEDQSSSTGTSGAEPTVNGTTASEVPMPDPIQGCVPSCNTPGITEPGPLSPGAYETQWFFGGEMVVTLEERWSSHEDSTGEFAVALDATPENGVFFWEDVYPVEDGMRVDGVPLTAAGLVDWLKSSSQVDVSSPTRGMIGDLPATVVDVNLAPEAVNDEDNAYCRARTCALFLGFPQWDGPWGIAGRQVQRIYLSDVTYGAQDHLFVVVIYPDDPADIETFSGSAERLIDSVRVPAAPA